MCLASYQDLCLEAGDPERVARFWAGALSLRAEQAAEGSYRLVGDNPYATVNVYAAPPGRVEGFRIHFDINASEVSTLMDLGADPVDDLHEGPWLVLRGPEGAEMRVFPSSDPIDHHRYEFVICSDDPSRSARWWAHLLDATFETASGGDYAWLTSIPNAPFETILFVRPEGKPTNRRIRLRFTTSDLAGLMRHGAAMTNRGAPSRLGYTMSDPTGTEFLVLANAPSEDWSPRRRTVIGPR